MATGNAFQVRLQETDEVITAAAGQSILDAAEDAGVTIPCDCREGWCGMCRIRILEGDVAYDEPPMALAPEEMDAGFAQACQARPTSDLVISIATPPLLLEPQRREATLRDLRIVAEGVLCLEIGFADGAAPGFVPGQYMNVTLDDGSTRSFSMASLPGPGAMSFYLRRISGGGFTDRALGTLQPGASLDVELPLGGFRCHHEDGLPLLMVATGTGIAPIRAMLESLLDSPGRPPITLYWGMRKAGDLFLHEEFLTWAARWPDFAYRPVLSQPGPDWAGRRGHVQDAVAADLAELSGFAIHLCGSPMMIAEAKERFFARGASPECVFSEGFTHQQSNLPDARKPVMVAQEQ